jgi:hypothetical protein
MPDRQQYRGLYPKTQLKKSGQFLLHPVARKRLYLRRISSGTWTQRRL